jgi:hypothetical protein
MVSFMPYEKGLFGISFEEVPLSIFNAAVFGGS